MAADFYQMNRTLPLANQVLSLLDRLSADFASLKALRLSMIEQQDGDGSQDAHYALHVTLYGYPNTATAHASFAEIDSFVGSGGPSLEQCTARHRQ
jgi:hypothetical protein